MVKYYKYIGWDKPDRQFIYKKTTENSKLKFIDPLEQSKWYSSGRKVTDLNTPDFIEITQEEAFAELI